MGNENASGKFKEFFFGEISIGRKTAVELVLFALMPVFINLVDTIRFKSKTWDWSAFLDVFGAVFILTIPALPGIFACVSRARNRMTIIIFNIVFVILFIVLGFWFYYLFKIIKLGILLLLMLVLCYVAGRFLPEIPFLKREYPEAR